MTLEKLKRFSFRGNFRYYCLSSQKVSRREARKLIRHELKNERWLIRKRKITKRTRFLCNHCGKALRFSQWIWEAGAVIRCPKCLNEIMDICFTKRIEV